jgi:hypothetical protein
MYTSGHIKSGWFGGIDAAGNVTSPGADGKPVAYDGVTAAKYATAAIAYAVAKRDSRLISPFANGITIEGAFGRLKDK